MSDARTVRPGEVVIYHNAPRTRMDHIPPIPLATADKATVAKAVNEEQNEARLASCTGPHSFLREAKVDEQGHVIAGTGLLRCMKCHGRITAEQQAWYNRGLFHGRYGADEPKKRPPAIKHDEGLGGKKGVV